MNSLVNKQVYSTYILISNQNKFDEKHELNLGWLIGKE